jgi:hypothetical protein
MNLLVFEHVHLTFGRRSDGCTMIPLAAGTSSEKMKPF